MWTLSLQDFSNVYGALSFLLVIKIEVPVTFVVPVLLPVVVLPAGGAIWNVQTPGSKQLGLEPLSLVEMSLQGSSRVPFAGHTFSSFVSLQMRSKEA